MSTESMHKSGDEAIGDAAAKILSPVARLELSRARMRLFLDKRRPAAGTSAPMTASSVGAKMSEWADGFRANPLLGAVVDAVQGWWANHPLHLVTEMAGDAVEDLAVPWIRRYPLAVVGGALAVGVVASRLKPWRWFGRRALLAGLTSQIAAQLMTHAPLEFLIDSFTKFAKPKPRATSPSDAAAAPEVAPMNDHQASTAAPAFSSVSPSNIVTPAAPAATKADFADATAAI